MYSIISIELCWNVTLCAPTSRNYPYMTMCLCIWFLHYYILQVKFISSLILFAEDSTNTGVFKSAVQQWQMVSSGVHGKPQPFWRLVLQWRLQKVGVLQHLHMQTEQTRPHCQMWKPRLREGRSVPHKLCWYISYERYFPINLLPSYDWGIHFSLLHYYSQPMRPN